MENEPKETFDKAVDSVVDGHFDRGAAAPEASSPQTSAPEPKDEGGSDPLKTPSNPAAGGEKVTPGKEFGPVPYDKFQEAIRKRQEAERQLQNFSSLLDDPEVFKRYLERQGYSKDEIREEMRSRGMAVHEPGQAKSIYDRVMERVYGDRAHALKPEEAAEIRNIVALIEAASREIADETTRPLKGFVESKQREEAVDAELSEAEEAAKEDGIDFEKEAIPGMQLLLKEMQDRDPRYRRNPPSAMFLYNAAARRILKEKTVLRGRQEARDEKKGNARPLSPQVTGKPAEPKKHVKTADIDAEIDAQLDAMGYRG